MIPYKLIEINGKIQKGEVAQERENSLVKYNSYGNLIEKIFYQKNNDLARKYTYVYNEKQQRTLVDYYKVENNLNFQYKYKYDEQGNRIEITEYTKKDFFIRKRRENSMKKEIF